MTNALFRIGLLLIVAAGFSGCTTADLDAAMARAKAVSAAIKNGAAVTASAVRQGIDDACASQAAAGIAYQSARAILLQQTGPNSTANIDALDKAMTGYTTVCAQAQDPTRSDLSSLLSRALAAYAAFQSAKAKAGV
jgi:hypothetical protein